MAYEDNFQPSDEVLDIRGKIEGWEVIVKLAGEENLLNALYVGLITVYSFHTEKEIKYNGYFANREHYLESMALWNRQGEKYYRYTVT